MMQGEMGVTDAPGHGSLFWFTLQLEKPPQERLVDVGRIDIALGPRGALVVDDLRDCLSVL